MDPAGGFGTAQFLAEGLPAGTKVSLRLRSCSIDRADLRGCRRPGAKIGFLAIGLIEVKAGSALPSKMHSSLIS